MTEKRKAMVPPPIKKERPTERPTEPLERPSPSEKAELDATVLANLEKLAREEREKLGEAAEKRQLEQETRPELALAEADLLHARAPKVPAFDDLDVTSTAAPKAGIEDVEAYRAWLQAKLRGDSPEKA